MVHTQERIAVLRALQLGDMLCATPVLCALRTAYPAAQITLIGLPWSRDFAARCPDLVDDVLDFPGWPGIPEAPFDPAASLAFLQRCQAEPFDLVVQLQGSGLASNAFVQLMAGRNSAGFHPPGLDSPGPGFTPYIPHGHESERLLRLAHHLGWPVTQPAPFFPLTEDDRREFDELARELGLSTGQYAVIHAGARDPARRWRPENFAAVGDALVRSGFRVLLTGVQSEEAQLLAVAQAMHESADMLCGRTSLGALACLLKESRLLVSNDTGLAHIAAALDVPSIIVFTHSDPERWAAKDPTLHRAFVEPTALANPCCDHGTTDHRCIGDACRLGRPRQEAPVEVSHVIEAALALSVRNETRDAAAS